MLFVYVVDILFPIFLEPILDLLILLEFRYFLLIFTFWRDPNVHRACLLTIVAKCEHLVQGLLGILIKHPLGVHSLRNFRHLNLISGRICTQSICNFSIIYDFDFFMPCSYERSVLFFNGLWDLFLSWRNHFNIGSWLKREHLLDVFVLRILMLHILGETILMLLTTDTCGEFLILSDGHPMLRLFDCAASSIGAVGTLLTSRWFGVGCRVINKARVRHKEKFSRILWLFVRLNRGLDSTSSWLIISGNYQLRIFDTILDLVFGKLLVEHALFFVVNDPRNLLALIRLLLAGEEI